MRWRKCMKPPNCTFCELRWEIESLLKTKYRDFKPFVLSQNVEVFLGFLKSSDFLCDKLHRGKIEVWGHETKYDHPEDPLPPERDIRRSPKQVLIPKSYWKLNRINLPREYIREIDTYNDEEIEYTRIKFNKKQALREIEEFFAKDPQEVFDRFNKQL